MIHMKQTNKDLIPYLDYTSNNTVLESLRELQSHVNPEMIQSYQEYVKIVCTGYTGSEYAENHHILPKSVGGLNGDNLVRLLAQDHFIAHKLLNDFCVGELGTKMGFAIHRMCNSGKYIITPNEYALARTKQSNRMKNKWKNPEYRQKMTQMSNDMWTNPEHQHHMSLIRKENVDIEFMRKISTDFWCSDEGRELASINSRIRWQNPEYQQKMSIIATNRCADNDYKAAVVERMKNKWKNPEYRQKMTQMSNDMWTNPERLANASILMTERMSTIENRTRSSITMTNNNNNPIFRENQLKSLKKLNQDPEFNKKRINGLRRVICGGIYITPKGEFESAKLASEPNGVHFNVVLSRCKGKSRAKTKEAKDKQNKQWADEGWGFRPYKEEYCHT